VWLTPCEFKSRHPHFFIISLFDSVGRGREILEKPQKPLKTLQD